jgi:oligoribonuclease
VRKFLFVDTETTGLNPQKDSLLELALIVTDSKLNELEVYETVIHQSQYVLDGMNNWALESHTNSGLVSQVRSSKVTVGQVEQEVLEILARHFSGPEKPILSGSSIHFDKKFIDHHMPNLSKRLHYRLIDCTSFSEALKIFNGEIPEKKPVAHRALADIRDSIAYLKAHLVRFK